jgi:hypothetical protein
MNLTRALLTLLLVPLTLLAGPGEEDVIRRVRGKAEYDYNVAA